MHKKCIVVLVLKTILRACITSYTPSRYKHQTEEPIALRELTDDRLYDYLFVIVFLVLSTEPAISQTLMLIELMSQATYSLAFHIWFCVFDQRRVLSFTHACRLLEE